jgi:energy-coupling factor transporter ATP-binding protein EcfA2
MRVEPYAGHIVLDVPAPHPTLKFGRIAEALSNIVLASEPQFAVGIFGGWGSGKSTLMDEIERLVAADGAAVVVRFNAWRYEREPHLIIPLLDTIRADLAAWASRPEHAGVEGERVRAIARRVGRVVRALVRATSFDVAIPGVASVTVDPGKALDEMSERPDDEAESPQSLYYGAFQELSDAFSGVQRGAVSRIVVFVDDLDRCLPERALTVLESMKLFFDMPGFVFVVGLDERVVTAAVRTKFTREEHGVNAEVDRQVEREYLKKIFQVPYTLPSMAPEQLGDLLAWLDEYGHLSNSQREDLHHRVSRYLRYVATENRINPREVKRYINAYTLSRMIRPDLDPDTMLALQTMDFRPDWERVYEDVVLAEADVFGEILRQFRDGDDRAFEDLWPEIGVIPLELAAFFRSSEAEPLARPHDLQRYVSFLETTRSTQGWVKDAMRDVGLLRRQVRSVRPDLAFESPEARELAIELKDIMGRFTRYTDGPGAAGLAGPLGRLGSLVDELTASPSQRVADADRVERWRVEVAAETDMLQQQLRLVRRSSTLSG